MPLSTISNGESGSSVRTKINTAFAAIDAVSAQTSGTSGTAGSSGSSGQTGSSGSSGTAGTSGTSPAASGPLSASVQTTNGATTSVATLTMGTYSTYSIEATVAAWENSNMLSYGSQLFAVFSNNGLAVSQVSTTDVYEKSAFSTATSHIILDTEPKIVVIGEASKTINWTINYSVTKI